MEYALIPLQLVLSFLMGSIPWGFIISRTVYHTDIREHGSGNIGATNALRIFGAKMGACVFLLDAGKGVASGLLAMLLCWFVYPGGGLEPGPLGSGYQLMVAASVCGCVFGHVFCPWLGFHGGKGIAVAIGCVLVSLGWPYALLLLAVFVAVVASTRYVSAGSVLAAAVFPFLAAFKFWGAPGAWLLCFIPAVLVIWAHRGNIQRLRAGTENKLGKKKD